MGLGSGATDYGPWTADLNRRGLVGRRSRAVVAVLRFLGQVALEAIGLRPRKFVPEDDRLPE